MSKPPKRITDTEAYRMGGGVLIAAIAVIMVALGFEHIVGFKPCELCYMQRWGYYFSIPVAFAALSLVSAEKAQASALLFFGIALAFLATTGLAVYQAGAAWQFWPGPASCSGASTLATDAGNLLEAVKQTTIVRCDKPQIRILGLSFAGWNAMISLALFAAALKAAFAAAERR